MRRNRRAESRGTDTLRMLSLNVKTIENLLCVPFEGNAQRDECTPDFDVRRWEVLAQTPPPRQQTYFSFFGFSLSVSLRSAKTRLSPTTLVASATSPRASTSSWGAPTNRRPSTPKTACGSPPSGSRAPGCGRAGLSPTPTLWWVPQK